MLKRILIVWLIVSVLIGITYRALGNHINLYEHTENIQKVLQNKNFTSIDDLTRYYNGKSFSTYGKLNRLKINSTSVTFYITDPNSNTSLYCEMPEKMIEEDRDLAGWLREANAKQSIIYVSGIARLSVMSKYIDVRWVALK